MKLCFAILPDTKECFRLDLSGSPKSWETMTHLIQERAYHALAFVEAVGKVYCIGGEPNSFSKVSNNVFSYDFSTGLTGAWHDVSM